MELKTTVKDLGRMPWFYRANSRTGKIFIQGDKNRTMVKDFFKMILA